MNKINRIVEKFDRALKTMKSKKIWKKVFPIFLISIVLIGFSFVIYAKYTYGIGTSGIYVCSFVNDANENVEYSKLVVYLDNKCQLTTYFKDENLLAEPEVGNYCWSIKYNRTKKEDIDKRVPYSCFQFSFDNKSGGSMFQYYFFPNEQKMVMKSYVPFFNNGLAIFNKI